MGAKRTQNRMRRTYALATLKQDRGGRFIGSPHVCRSVSGRLSMMTTSSARRVGASVFFDVGAKIAAVHWPVQDHRNCQAAKPSLRSPSSVQITTNALSKPRPDGAVVVDGGGLDQNHSG